MPKTTYRHSFGMFALACEEAATGEIVRDASSDQCNQMPEQHGRGQVRGCEKGIQGRSDPTAGKSELTKAKDLDTRKVKGAI